MKQISSFLLIIFTTLVGICNAQNISFQRTLEWQIYKNTVTEQSVEQKLLSFDNAIPINEKRFLPQFIEITTINLGNIHSAKLTVLETKRYNNGSETPYFENLDDDYILSTNVGYEAGNPKSFIFLTPIKRIGNQVEVITKFKIEATEVRDLTYIPVNSGSFKKKKTYNSKLNSGNWYKIQVANTGVYKITGKYLNDKGISTSGIDVNKISIFGYGGKELPMANADDRPEDMAQIPSGSVGLDDGVFNENDFIYFYAQGPITWKANATNEHITHLKHTYTDTITYFLQIGAHQRIKPSTVQNINGNPTMSTNSYDYLYVHHIDKYSEINKTIKTGKQWFGEEFNFNLTQTFNVNAIRDLKTSQPIRFRSSVAARSINARSSFDIKINNQLIFNQSVASVDGVYTNSYVKTQSQLDEFTTNSNSLSIEYTFNKGTSNAIGWLNFFEINARADLNYGNSPFFFRDFTAIGGTESIIEYNIKNANNSLVLWDVTDINNIKQQEYAETGGNLSFKVSGGSAKEFVLFNPNDAALPIFKGQISNQNLHNLPFADMFIVTHRKFVDAANELAQFHEKEDGYTTNVVIIDQIYNEFSSGNQDVSAIRDLLRFYYSSASNEDEKPKYLLIMGDASYDFKNRISGNTNYVPAYQSNNSTDPGSSYVSDDYYGLLDPNEGNWESSNSNDLLDISIGRMPVQTLEQANNMVNKVKAYYAQASLGDWRNDICFVADDEDGNLHLNDTEDLVNLVDTTYPLFNIKKIYFDAYVQEVAPGGARYPDVEKRISETVESGVLVINYMGHGGEQGWAHERVLDNNTILGWQNINRLPLMVTATCEFSRFDDPERVSAGENVFLNPKGGAIAMLTTTRIVYASSNKALLDKLYGNNIFEPINGRYRTLGEIIKTTKNATSLNVNTRNFTLLGDPAVRLAFPQVNVQTTSINGKTSQSSVDDTLSALSKVTIEGIVTDKSGNQLKSFNGTLYPSVYDKYDSLQTLNNDPESPKRKFVTRKNIIFKGKATVKNGAFKFEFVVPKDISYKIGDGKISYYTENGEIDGNGYDFSIKIGGTSADAIEDNNEPIADLFINDLNFSFGGLSNENPNIIGVVSDDNGINTIGTGIGHELIMVIDNGQPIVVNEFYESELDDYKSGKITYPAKGLSEGRHSVSLKVWDVANNSAEAYTEFVVAGSAELALKHVLNYPNPFTTSTMFRFEHNRPGDLLDIKIQVFNISGTLVKTLTANQVTSGAVINNINWDGTDEFGNILAKGVYVYRIKVVGSDGASADETQKLVILR